MTFHRKSLVYHWRANLPVLLGAAAATSALTGALIVGDSMRESLARIALGRLGRVDHALVAQRFFSEDLVARLTADAQFQTEFAQAVPLIVMQAGATHAELRTRAGKINLMGIDDRFWNLSEPPMQARNLSGRTVLLNDSLARQLRAQAGDDVLIHTSKPSAISAETLLGRRDETASTLRLPLGSVIPAGGLGGFTLNMRQTHPLNAFVPLPTLQRSLGQMGRVNAVLVSQDPDGVTSPDGAEKLQRLIDSHAQLDDLDLTLRTHTDHGYVALESRSVLIPPVVETAATGAAGAAGMRVTPILTHLANSITVVRKDAGPTSAASTPYSTIAAFPPDSPVGEQIARQVRDGAGAIGPDEILLNRWAADDLAAKPGDRIAVTYYVTGSFGQLETRTAEFTLRGIVEMQGAAVDPGFIPDYPGVTDTENLADWDPPFPVDLTKVRPKDEGYWDQYRTTPKAFVTLSDGQRLWAGDGDRFGRLTSIRFSSADEDAARELRQLPAAAQRIERELLGRLDPKSLGLAFEPVRARALSASRGTTDFSTLFLGFSFFLIAAAAMLVALLFRLGVEGRAHEMGLLLAAGFSPRKVGLQLVAQGVLIAALGGAVGLLGACGYAWLMLTGLRSWWSAAVNAPFLVLHVRPSSLLIGFAIGAAIASLSAGWAVRDLTRKSVRSLLAGSLTSPSASFSAQPRRCASWVAALSFAVAVGSMIASAFFDAIPSTAAFFASGAFMLIGCIALFARWLAGESTSGIHQPGAAAVVRLAVRNAPRHRGRSITITALIAAATFLIVALEAFRIDPSAAGTEKHSGTGGFSLYAESAVPLPYDLNTPAGREALGVEGLGAAGDQLSVLSFRLRPGDTTSCTSLYVPVEPRIIGASDAMIERGGFRFASQLDPSPAAGQNPWRLLDEPLDEGVIPAIGDEAAVRWQLHLGLGREMPVTSENGDPVHLRFVALLQGSALQDEIIISDRNFRRLFPSISGPSFFLIEAPPESAPAVEQSLERELERFSFDAALTKDRLASYSAVQNTYLSTFQALGGFGLLLGTLGLAAVVLRNVWERRREFALLRAVGYSSGSIGALVLIENALLVACGLLAGTVSAFVAVAPRMYQDAGDVPWTSIALLLAVVLATGMVAGGLGFRAAVRAPLIASLRAE